MSRGITMADALLMKYLLQEADAEEVQRVEAWLRSSAENQKRFDELKFIWEESLRMVEGNKDSESIAWNKLENRLNLNNQAVSVNSKRSYLSYKYILAASILLVCSMGWFMFNYFRAPETINVVAKEQVMKSILPDGSKVTLNKNTLISYPSSFKGSVRPVKLQGEAFFNVAHNASKPFVISVNDMTVRVLGTSFNVKSRAGKTVITVETGVVRVSRLQNSIELHRGEYMTIDQQQKKLSKKKNDNQLYDYYRSNELKCESTPLYELVDVMNEKFKADIVIVSPELRNVLVTADFTNKSLAEIMDVVSITFKIRVEKENQKLLLK